MVRLPAGPWPAAATAVLLSPSAVRLSSAAARPWGAPVRPSTATLSTGLSTTASVPGAARRLLPSSTAVRLLAAAGWSTATVRLLPATRGATATGRLLSATRGATTTGRLLSATGRLLAIAVRALPTGLPSFATTPRLPSTTAPTTLARRELSAVVAADPARRPVRGDDVPVVADLGDPLVVRDVELAGVQHRTVRGVVAHGARYAATS